MPEGGVQSILRCAQCNKPFDRHSSLKRHGYYCRSRRAGSTTRSRSCLSCAGAKARCDNRFPECSRCIGKTIKCVYPANTPKIPGQVLHHGNNVSTQQRMIPPCLEADSDPPGVRNQADASNNSDISLESAVISVPGTANIGEENLHWDDIGFDFADFIGPEANDETIQYASLGSSSPVRHSTPGTYQILQPSQETHFSNLSIPMIPTSVPRLLVQRPNFKAGRHNIANLISCTLKSYPLMMMRSNTLPPFIHPLLISSDVEDTSMEPLTNCINLMHMISKAVQGSRKLFWRNVRLECERLCAEHVKLNKWALLAAMQALSIYILVRLHEGETDHNNFDVLLFATITVIAKSFARSDAACDDRSSSYNSDPKTNWKEWVFKESRRRLSVVFQIVNILVYFDPAAMCELQTDLILAPLPAKKRLWEAADESLWKAEIHRDAGAHSDFGLAANGDLVELDEDQSYCGDPVLLYRSLASRTSFGSIIPWEEWCSGMDGLGGLIMLVASLLV